MPLQPPHKAIFRACGGAQDLGGLGREHTLITAPSLRVPLGTLNPGQ